MTKKRGVPRRRVLSRDRVHRDLPVRHYVPHWKRKAAEQAPERRLAPLFTDADDARMLVVVNRALDFRTVEDEKNWRAQWVEREAWAVECASGGNFQPLAALLQDIGLALVAEWVRKGMVMDRRRRAPQDRSLAHQAARELPAIRQILREQCGDGSRERAIKIVLLRYPRLQKEILLNHLRSRHRPRFK
jgi:hypothetical protein